MKCNLWKLRINFMIIVYICKFLVEILRKRRYRCVYSQISKIYNKLIVWIELLMYLYDNVLVGYLVKNNKILLYLLLFFQDIIDFIGFCVGYSDI